MQTPRTFAQSELAIVTLKTIRVYSSGVELEVDANATAKDKSPNDLYAESLSKESSEGRPPDALLRFGIRFADGSKTTTLDTPFAPTFEPVGPVLWRRGGSGDHIDGNSVRSKWILWLWPLPKPEPMVLVVEWPAFNIKITGWPLDGAAVTEAARSMKNM